MNNFSCSLSCTRMTIIDCLSYASDSYLEMFHGGGGYIAKLLVAWLYEMNCCLFQ